MGCLWALLPLLIQPLDRSRLPVPPARIFESMLRLAEEGDLDRVRRSTEALAPVMAEHERVLGAAEHGETTTLLRSAEKDVVLRGVRRLVARDVIVLLRSMRDAPPDRARTLLLTAALEWRLLEAAVAGRDMRSAQGISARFRDLSAATSEGDSGAIGAIVGGVEADLRTALR